MSTYIEHGENTAVLAIPIESEESDQWKLTDKDNVTILRLSGLPKELRPLDGLEDELGDWIITWKSIRDQSNQIILLSDTDWSGDSTIQVMISQLQEDGTIRSSNIQTSSLTIKPEADKPILKVKSQLIQEDEEIKLEDIISRISSTDKDNSEEIGVKLLRYNGLEVINRVDGTITEDKEIFINESDISDYILKPKENDHGLYTIEMEGYAQEYGDINSMYGSTIITVTAAPDGLKGHLGLNNGITIREGEDTKLTDIIKYIESEDLLIDKDGSEEILVEITLSDNFSIEKQESITWIPVNQETSNTGEKTYTVLNSDLSELNLRYEKVESDKPPMDQVIKANYMTRERSNGRVKRSATKEGKISIDYDARVPIEIPRETILYEDKWEILKDSLPIIKPYFSEDEVYVKDIEIPSGLKIKNIVTGDEREKACMMIFLLT